MIFFGEGEFLDPVAQRIPANVQPAGPRRPATKRYSTAIVTVLLVMPSAVIVR